MVRRRTRKMCRGIFFLFSNYLLISSIDVMGYLALVVTVVDIVNGAAYLFEKEPPQDRKNWKAELELEQYRNVLKMEENKKVDTD